MKPIQIGLLVVAGAIGGALVMKWQSSRQAPAPAPVAATAPAPVATPPATPPPAEAEAPAAQRPSPMAAKRENAREIRREPRVRRTPRVAKPEPVAVAETQPPAVQEPAAADPANQAPLAPPPAVTRAEPAPKAVPPSPPPEVTLNAGTLIPIRLVEGLSSDRNMPGDAFTATLDAPLVVDGYVIAERGARVEGNVVESDKAGRVKGVSSIGIQLTRLRTSDGQNVRIQTDTFQKTGPKTVKQDVAKVGIASAIGAAIGAIAGGGKGAGIGAAVGGAAGTGGVLATRGKPAVLPTETRISFRLSSPVSLTERISK